jgi:cell division protein ZapA
MNEDNASVTIRLQDREYRISCAPDERDDLKRAATYLDEKMQEIKAAKVVGLDRIAVMAALNIAHELLMANKSLKDQQDQKRTLSRLTERMDKEIRAFNDYRNDLI